MVMMMTMKKMKTIRVIIITIMRKKTMTTSA